MGGSTRDSSKKPAGVLMIGQRNVREHSLLAGDSSPDS